MLQVAWRDVRFHPVRFLMSVLAVALGVAFVSGTFALRAMMASTFDGIVATTVSGDAYVVADNDSSYAPDWMVYLDERGLVSDSLVRPIEALDEVGWAAADYTGAVQLTGADGTLVASGGGAPSQSWIVDDTLTDQGFELTGTAPVGENQVALEAETARRAGLGIGDTTTVVLGAGASHQVTVTGIVDSTEGTPFAGAVVVGIDRATAKAAFAPTGAVTTIVVHAADGVSQDDLAQAVGSVLPADAAATVRTGDAVRADAREAIDSQLGFISTLLMVFAGIALFVGAFIIANTFSMVVRQRLRETAVLRAVGASRRQVFVSFVVQAGIIGLLGSAVGIGLGFGLVTVIRRVFDSMGMALSGAIPVTVPGVVVPIVVGVVVSMVAAALPARRAARTAPVEAMRPDGQDTQRSLVVRGVVGTVLTLAGVGLLVAAHQAGTDGGVLLAGGALALLVGLLVVAPVLAPAVTRVLAVPFTLARPFGTLAQRNLARNQRRTANTAAALMIGMALVGAATVLASSATVSVADVVDRQLKADFVLDGQASASGIPAPALAELDQVRGATVWSAGDVPASVGEPGSAKAMFLGVGDPQMLVDVLALNVVAGSTDAWVDGVALGEPVAEQLDLTVGDQVSLTIAKDTPFEVSTELPVQIVTSNEAISIDLMITDQTLAALVPAEARDQLLTTQQAFVVLDPGADAEAVRAQLVDIVAPYQTVSVMDADEFASLLSSQVTQILNVMYALIALSLVIAILGVVNTLALSVLERTQEIGMMRAVGLGRGQLRATMVIEGVLVACLGAFLGISAGVGIAAVVPSITASMGLGVLSVNWLAVAALFAGAVVVGVLAAVWPAIRAARVPVLQALAYE